MAQQVATAESFTPTKIQNASLSTSYSSKYIELAPDIKPIFIVRDTDTGESIRQFPTEGQIRAYQRAQQAQAAAAQAFQPKVPTAETSTEEAAVLVESSVQYKEARQEIKKVDAPPAPLPGHTRAEVKTGGDTGSDVKVETTFSTSV